MDTTTPPLLRRRTFRWADPAPMAELRRGRSGFEYFRAVADGAIPQPPIYDLLGFRLADLAPGKAHFVGDLGEHLANPFGTVHGGYSATLLDSAAGVAVQSTLPVGMGVATIRLDVDYLRPVLPAMTSVQARSRVVHAGRRVAWSEAEILGPDDKLLVRGRGCFAIFPTGSGDSGPPAPPVYESKDIGWDDPGPLRQALLSMSGLDFIAAQSEGRLPLAPFHQTAHYRPTGAEPGRTRYVCEPDTFHYNPMGSVHGGLPAILIDTAGGAAIQTVQPPGRGAAAIGISVDYIRPMTRENGPLVTTGTVVRAGSRVAVADAEVTDGRGEVCARGTVTYFCYPLGRAA